MGISRDLEYKNHVDCSRGSMLFLSFYVAQGDREMTELLCGLTKLGIKREPF